MRLAEMTVGTDCHREVALWPHCWTAQHSTALLCACSTVLWEQVDGVFHSCITEGASVLLRQHVAAAAAANSAACGLYACQQALCLCKSQALALALRAA
jgi:hypothetical protein